MREKTGRDNREGGKGRVGREKKRERVCVVREEKRWREGARDGERGGSRACVVREKRGRESVCVFERVCV